MSICRTVSKNDAKDVDDFSQKFHGTAQVPARLYGAAPNDADDIDIVHGPDAESDDELDPSADWKTRTRIWWWQRTRGYLPIRDRKQRLVTHLGIT